MTLCYCLKCETEFEEKNDCKCPEGKYFQNYSSVDWILEWNLIQKRSGKPELQYQKQIEEFDTEEECLSRLDELIKTYKVRGFNYRCGKGIRQNTKAIKIYKETKTGTWWIGD